MVHTWMLREAQWNTRMLHCTILLRNVAASYWCGDDCCVRLCDMASVVDANELQHIGIAVILNRIGRCKHGWSDSRNQNHPNTPGNYVWACYLFLLFMKPDAYMWRTEPFARHYMYLALRCEEPTLYNACNHTERCPLEHAMMLHPYKKCIHLKHGTIPMEPTARWWPECVLREYTPGLFNSATMNTLHWILPS